MHTSWDEAPTTLQMPYTKAPLLRANCMAATVASGHTSFVTPYTSQKEKSDASKEGLDKVGAFVQQSLDNVDVHLVAVSANCTVAVDIPMTADEVIHISGSYWLAVQNHILKMSSLAS